MRLVPETCQDCCEQRLTEVIGVTSKRITIYHPGKPVHVSLDVALDFQQTYESLTQAYPGPFKGKCSLYHKQRPHMKQ